MRGLLIVLEGSDGSGKATQLNLLGERLKAAGYDIETFDFPQYENESSYFVRQYLNGDYGPAGEISPYTASIFYALDRYQASKNIKRALDAGKIVLCNRYVGANMAHQGGKFADQAEQRGFFVWADNFEFELLKIPRPDLNLFLRVPADVSFKLISERARKSGKELDEHERDRNHLKQALKTYDTLCQLFPKDFIAIECTKDGELQSIPQISNLIWNKLKPLLPVERPHRGHSAVVTLTKTSQTLKSANPSNQEKLNHEFKNASLLLKMNIERQVKSLEPTGFSVWSDYDYKYYTPMGLPKKVEADYRVCMDKLVELHRQMRQKLQKHYEQSITSGGQFGQHDISSLLLPATPLSALCSFRAQMSKKSLRRLSSSLLASDSPELQWTAKQLFMSAKNTWPQEFKQPLESEINPEPINHVIAKLAEDKLSLNSSDNNSVRLLEASPRQEFDLLAESIYPYSSLSLDEISEELSAWSYQQKYESFMQAVSDEKILEKIRYKFDVISDHLAVNKITSSAVVDGLQTQVASPRFGYEVPEALEQAGIDELYLECFDESLKLFSILQRADRDDLTVYSTLLGHKLRWQFSVDAKNLRTVLAQNYEPIHQSLIDSFREAVGEAHPLTWEVLSNTGHSIPAKTAHKRNRVKPSKRRQKSPNRKPADK